MTCIIEGCDSAPFRRGWCCSHYRNWQRRGHPLSTDRPPVVLEDIEWMVEAGESWHGVVARLRISDSALDKALRRWSRGDLAETLRRRVA